MVRALSADPGKRFNTCRSFAEIFLEGLRNRKAVVAVPQPPVGIADDGTREFDQVEYLAQLQRENKAAPEGARSEPKKVLFAKAKEVVNETVQDDSKQIWQRWSFYSFVSSRPAITFLLSLAVSLVIAGGVLFGIGALLQAGSFRLIDASDEVIVSCGIIGFVCTFIWRTFLGKYSAKTSAAALVVFVMLMVVSGVCMSGEFGNLKDEVAEQVQKAKLAVEFSVAVQEKIGAPIAVGDHDPIQIEEGATATFDFQIPVNGPDGSGFLCLSISTDDGQLSVEERFVEVGEERIDLDVEQ